MTSNDAHQIEKLESRIREFEAIAIRAADRGDVENVFSRYMHYHNAFQDEQIIPLWVSNGTPGIMSQYTNTGIYTTWESVIEYHQDRPAPIGKLIVHYTTTPVIEVAQDGKTAKGIWLMTGIESGLTDIALAESMPAYAYSPDLVEGKKVWAHWVWCKYGVDFLKQDGEWKIWKFRCFEIARAPYEENWISYASKNAEAFKTDLMYFGHDGKPKFMPKPDEPVKSTFYPFRIDTPQTLEPVPPVPHETFTDTFFGANAETEDDAWRPNT